MYCCETASIQNKNAIHIIFHYILLLQYNTTVLRIHRADVYIYVFSLEKEIFSSVFWCSLVTRMHCRRF